MPVDYRRPYDVREVIARLVDDSDFLDFKPLYGAQTVCGQAAIEGEAVGIVGNNGPIDADGSVKAAQFIQLCDQADTPLVFLQNTTGYMVGREAERAGIVKHGSKMIQAVANARVPKLTLHIGASFGAGNYGMCGRAYDPAFIFAWPNNRIAVMGPEQAAGVLAIVTEEKLKRDGKPVDARKLDAHESRRRRPHREGEHGAVRHRAPVGRWPDRPARQPPRARLLPVDLPRGARCGRSGRNTFGVAEDVRSPPRGETRGRRRDGVHAGARGHPPQRQDVHRHGDQPARR